MRLPVAMGHLSGRPGNHHEDAKAAKAARAARETHPSAKGAKGAKIAKEEKKLGRGLAFHSLKTVP